MPESSPRPSLTRIEMTLTPTDSLAEAGTEPGSDPELLSALLALHVPHGWEEESLPTGEVRCIVHSGHPGFCAELVRTMQAFMPDLAIASSTVEEENWAEAWKEFFTPVEGGRHFLVLAPWMEKERAETDRIPIIIEPKTAFGTGHHATTALCLEALSRLYSQGASAKAGRFLDLGTGSGILGIAAAKLGLCGDGLDIDTAAVDNAEENREINGLPATAFRVRQGSMEAATGPYDLILANILAAPLREMAPDIVAALAPGAVLVLSGLLNIQAEGVARAYTDLGLAPPERLVGGEGDEWAALIFQ